MAAAPTITSASDIITASKLEELSQLADRITDVLSTGVNAVTTVAPTKANSVDPQLSALI